MSELERWNRALCDLLLPERVNAGQPVVLSCDDESLRQAGELLGIDEHEALERLLATLRAHYRITASRGVRGIVTDAGTFSAATRPRTGPPPFLALLCMFVVAASRMDRSGGRVTQDYYNRLLELLSLPRADGHPPVVGFDLCYLHWRELAAWLAEDEGGRRGLLALPSEGHIHVGQPISQTIFRRRDRVLLSRFFARNKANIDAGWDMLTQLRRSGAALELTSHAAEMVESGEFEPLVRSALRSAYAAWDGSLSDETGGRLWPARLRLAASARGISLAFSCERFAAEVELEGPSGTLTLPGFPLEHELPLRWLDRLAAGRLALAVRGRNEAVALPSGETLLFEAGEEGMLHVGAAGAEPVWVLSRDPLFRRHEYDQHRYLQGTLPERWTLLAALDPALLPAALRRKERAGRADVTLEGGLALGPSVYLHGFPPLLVAGAIEQPLEVSLDGEPLGELAPFAELSLGELATGAHMLEAGPAGFPFELATRGRREGIGELRWDIGDAPLYRAGATREGHAGRTPVGPFVCGALLSEIERPARPEPLLLRTNTLALCVYSDGDVQGHARPQPAGWMRSVGLPDGAARWRVPDGERVEWLVLTGSAPRVVRVGAGAPAPNGALCDLVDRFRDAPVHALSPSGRDVEAEWRALCRACEELDEGS